LFLLVSSCLLMAQQQTPRRDDGWPCRGGKRPDMSQLTLRHAMFRFGVRGEDAKGYPFQRLAPALTLPAL